jgi:hypothetical protein
MKINHIVIESDGSGEPTPEARAVVDFGNELCEVLHRHLQGGLDPNGAVMAIGLTLRVLTSQDPNCKWDDVIECVASTPGGESF